MSIDDSVSEAIGSEGTGTGSRTGSGGVGGREPPAEVEGGGETGGRATGGFFFPHAPVAISAIIATTTTIRLCFIVSAFSLVCSLFSLRFRLVPLPCAFLLRPIRIPVHSDPSDLLQVLPVAIDHEDLRLAGSRRRERDVASIRRERRALVAADAVGDRPARRRCHIVDPDVVAGPRL